MRSGSAQHLNVPRAFAERLTGLVIGGVRDIIAVPVRICMVQFEWASV